MEKRIVLDGHTLFRIVSDVQSMIDDTGCSLGEAVVVLRDCGDHLNVVTCRIAVPADDFSSACLD